VSGCNGTVPESYALSGTILAALDWNGDKRTDLLVANGSTIDVYLSTATGAPSLTATSIPYSSTCQYVTMDTTGDGLDDLGCWSQSGSNPVTYYPHNGVSDLAAFFADGYGNSISPTYLPLTNPNVYTIGSNATFPYMNYIGPLYVVNQATFSDPSNMPGGTYQHSYAYFWAWMNLQGRGFGGFSGGMTVTDSRTGVNSYPSYNAGFPYTGMLVQNWISAPNTASAFTSKLTNTLNVITLDNTPNNQRVFPYVATSTSLKYELGGTENGDQILSAVTNYSYDNYGNATSIVRTVTDTDPSPPYSGDTWTTSVTNTTDISVNPTTDLAEWCLPLLDKTQVVYSSQINGNNAVTRTQAYTLDTPTNCRVMGVTTEPNSSLYKVTESLGFDGFGNINSDTVTGANMPSSPASRVTTSNWGTTGQFLTSQTDPSGATTTWTYGSAQSLAFGVPDSAKNANNLTTSWGYDAFGRKSTETRPDGTSTSWTWSPCASQCGWSNSVYQISQTAYQNNGAAIRTDTDLYDSVDRVTETSGPTVTGATEIVQKLYNSSGLLIQQSIPFLSGAPAYQQTYTYDALKRPLTITRPISSTNTNLQSTTFGYSGRTRTVKDPYSHVTTMMMDVNGNLLQTQDPVGYKVTRSYDAAGSLIGITDNVGNTLLKNVTYQYGIKPFVVASTDADRGAWTYTVDALGERTGWTDAKGQSFSMTYDALSRPLTRMEPDLFTQWTWGSTPAMYNVGQLITECTGTTGTPPMSCGNSPIYSEIRKFDTVGRLSTRAITQSGNPGNDPGGVFQFTLGYSTTTGLLNTLTYPTSTSGVALNIQYGYQYGILQSVTDTTDTASTCGSTCVLWTANAMNGFGQITQETLGNGVVTNRNYDGVTSWLTSVTAGVGGGAALLNQSYLQDEDGNVIQRQNNNLGLTENFAYDADNRLTCSMLGGSCSTPTLVYDGGSAGPGNITSQTGVGSYAYPAAGQPQPHAVTSITGTFNGITNPPFSYDANGNMTARASSAQNITWSSYNYPTAISASDATGNEEVQLFYGPDRQRWYQIYTNSTTTEQTYYIGGLVDLVFSGGTTNYRHYIYAGNEPVAVYSRTAAGVNTMSYVLEDHQGGVSAIASSAGTADVNESFSAFGTRRNPTTWSGAPTTTDLNTIASLSRQGYTFQTALGQSMGLNHMNGRVQDAILGRFLSPDPQIPEPTNAQSYNRYSYVNNNPLSETDPTGFDNDSCSTSGCPGGSNSPPLINPAPVDPGPLNTVNIPSPPTYTGSMIPGYAPGNLYCFGCAVSNSGTGGTTGTGGTAADGGAAAGGMTTQSGGSAQSGVCGPCAPSQGGTPGTVWGDGNGGFTDATAGATVTAAPSSASESDIASTTLTLAGAGTAGIEAQFGERFLGTNGRLYTRAWANGIGRSYSISGLTKLGGGYLFLAGTFFDLQSLQDGDITNGQFYTNFGLGALSLTSSYFAIGSLNALMINNVYPGGFQGYYEDFFLDPNNALMITGGYDGLR
jgi:RHS repeat-associated protein